LLPKQNFKLLKIEISNSINESVAFLAIFGMSSHSCSNAKSPYLRLVATVLSTNTIYNAGGL